MIVLGPVPPELVEAFADGETGGAQAPLAGALLALGGLRLDEAAQQLGVGPLGPGGLGGELTVVTAVVGEVQILELFLEGEVGGHGW